MSSMVRLSALRTARGPRTSKKTSHRSVTNPLPGISSICCVQYFMPGFRMPSHVMPSFSRHRVACSSHAGTPVKWRRRLTPSPSALAPSRYSTERRWSRSLGVA